ncbi:MAG: integrase core domain-containing protein, partial [Lachnospiraceae bacterium]
ALESQTQIKEELILHSDQGSQYTSKAFVELYFNTLKNECVNLYEFQTEEALYQAVEEFAYVTYNHVRPHSYNGYRTPYQARTAS